MTAPIMRFLKRRAAKVAGLAGLAGLLCGYGWIQAKGFTPGTGEDDCEGYFILGKRLAAGEPAGVVEPDPFAFQSHVWVRNGRGELLPKYAPGYPLLVGLAARLGGDRAAFAVSPVCGGLALVGAWLLFGVWMRPLAALLATTVLACNPAFLDYASYPLSHIPEMAFAVWGCWSLWRWLRQPVSWCGAVATGLLLGAAAGIRHTAILMAAPAGVAVIAALARRGRRNVVAARVVAMAAAFAVVPVAVALYQWRWFGAPMASGYALTGEQDALHWRFALANFGHLNDGIQRQLAPFVAPLGLVGMLAVGPRTERAMRVLAFLGTYVVYLSYYWAPASMAYYRFLLPAVPLLVGSAFLLLDACLPTPSGRRLAVVVTAAACLSHAWPNLSRRAFEGRLLSSAATGQAVAGKAIAPHLDDDAVLFLAPPLDTGMGAFRRYRPYALNAFDPLYIERKMPVDAESMKPGRAMLPQSSGENIMVQEARRAEWLDLYQRLGGEGLALKRNELAATWLRQGRQVAFLVPVGRRPWLARTFPELVLQTRATFETPGIGAWMLVVAEFPDAPDANGS